MSWTEVIKNPIVEMSSTLKFINLRSIEKIRNEKELLQISHDEIRTQLEEDTKSGKRIPPNIYTRTILNLRMLELKIAMSENDISYIIHNSIGTPGCVANYKKFSCSECGHRRCPKCSYSGCTLIDCTSQQTPGSIHDQAKSVSAIS